MRQRPGQDLIFWLGLPDHHSLKRNYSISSGPDERSYRISVKREPQGAASRRPVVLLSGGSASGRPRDDQDRPWPLVAVRLGSDAQRRP